MNTNHYIECKETHRYAKIRNALGTNDCKALKKLLRRSSCAACQFQINRVFILACQNNDLSTVNTMMQCDFTFDADGTELVFYKAFKTNNTKLLDLIMSYRPDLDDVLHRVIQHNLIGEYGHHFLKLYTEDSGARRMLELLHRLLTDPTKYITEEENKTLAPLHYLIENDLYWCVGDDMIDMLVKMKADVNVVNDDGDTALTLAINDDDFISIVPTLLKARADIDVKNDDGDTALMIAVENYSNLAHDIADIRKHRQHRGNLSSTTTSVEDYAKLVPMLIEAKADINTRNRSGETVLMVAAWNDSSIVPVLLKAGVDIDARDNSGDTALYGSVREDDTETALMLIEAKANVNIADNANV